MKKVPWGWVIAGVAVGMALPRIRGMIGAF